jgi:hypothetical protein
LIYSAAFFETQSALPHFESFEADLLNLKTLLISA